MDIEIRKIGASGIGSGWMTPGYFELWDRDDRIYLCTARTIEEARKFRAQYETENEREQQ